MKKLQIANNQNDEQAIVRAELSPSMMQMAEKIATSDLIPAIFQRKPANCLIAMEMAYRIRASILAVMQSMYIVHGKPGWSGQFMIGSVNATGRFTPLKFRFSADKQECRAVATSKATGEEVEGPPVSVAMAKAEGWWDRNPKWKNMTELMLTYRAGSFFGRVHTPDVVMGMREEGEIIDVPESDTIKQAVIPEKFSGRAAETADDGVTPASSQQPAADRASDTQAAAGTSSDPAPTRKTLKRKEPKKTKPTNLDRLLARLQEATYNEQQFLQVALKNKWVPEGTTDLATVPDPDLKDFVDDKDNWEIVILELAALTA
jgi:hypothetical protein